MKTSKTWEVTFRSCENCRKPIEKGKYYACLCNDCVSKKEGVNLHLHRNTKALELLCREEYYAARDARIKGKIQAIKVLLKERTPYSLKNAEELCADALLLLEGKEEELK